MYHHYTATLRYTSPHFTKLHFTTLIDTSLPLIYTSLPSHLASAIYISYCSISPPITKLDTVRIITSPKLFPKIMNPFTALRNLSPFHFTFLFFPFFHLSYLPFVIPGHLRDRFVISFSYEVFRRSEILHCVVE